MVLEPPPQSLEASHVPEVEEEGEASTGGLPLPFPLVLLNLQSPALSHALTSQALPSLLAPLQ